MPFKSAEQSKIDISPLGISEHAMTGQWRVIIARREDKARTWYYAENDAPIFAEALRMQAQRWLNGRD
jgi:hypothetical protein